MVGIELGVDVLMKKECGEIFVVWEVSLCRMNENELFPFL
mgnify:CR=1 FL=1